MDIASNSSPWLLAALLYLYLRRAVFLRSEIFRAVFFKLGRCFENTALRMWGKFPRFIFGGIRLAAKKPCGDPVPDNLAVATVLACRRFSKERFHSPNKILKIFGSYDGQM